MGFSFQALASGALPFRSAQGTHAGHADVAAAPASVHDDEKLAPPTTASAESDSDDEVNKIDTTAEAGVQAVQAASLLWTRRDLIMVYILYVFEATRPGSFLVER